MICREMSIWIEKKYLINQIIVGYNKNALNIKTSFYITKRVYDLPEQKICKYEKIVSYLCWIEFIVI